jgi:hypothetical protein
MKYYLLLLFSTSFMFCCKKETLPHVLSGIEIPMVGKWHQYGDTTFILKLNGNIDTIVHKMYIELNEDLTFICKNDPWFMNKFDSITKGTWLSDTATYNVINLKVMSNKTGELLSYPDNEIRWGVWPSIDTLLVGQEYNSQSGITHLSYRKFRKE